MGQQGYSKEWAENDKNGKEKERARPKVTKGTVYHQRSFAWQRSRKVNYPSTPALLNLIYPMSSFSPGLGWGVHIRAVSQNIRHYRCYSFLYGNSEAHLLL